MKKGTQHPTKQLKFNLELNTYLINVKPLKVVQKNEKQIEKKFFESYL